VKEQPSPAPAEQRLLLPETLLEPPLLPSGAPVLTPTQAAAPTADDAADEPSLYDTLLQPPPLPARPRPAFGAL
jgi:hypothetical protein